ncbi:MAG: sce7725 family protein [Desulfobacteraceae bacterium]|nr:sce7725 family protein [Desulfobacteraceae bacterium]
MYYPYLRGKQFELILLRENVELLSEHNIHPIIEPVKEDFTALIRAMGVLNEEEISCTLILNPRVGQAPVNSKKIIDELIEDKLANYENVAIGYILDAKASIPKLVSLLKQYENFNFTIIHYGYTDGKRIAKEINSFKNIKKHIFIDGFAGKLYQRHLKKKGIERILIRNGFKPKKKNAHYPPKEHFSDLHITYPDEGMDGFGDFLIVGDDYTETGGPAYAVAIHLTYLDNDEDMFIYHFISDQTDSPTNPAGKFKEALKKLVAKVETSKSLIYRSQACGEFLDLYKKGHYPGLGYVKKLSMQHHIELIANYISRES